MTTISFRNHADLVGAVIGRLTVTEFLGTTPTGTKAGSRPLYKCRCECGKETTAWKGQLVQGLKRSCGCLFKETLNARNTTHGQSKTRLFRIWAGIITRCTNPSSTGFERYGGIGISLCQVWADSFAKFREDVGDPPSGKHSLDRIDNSLGYYKANCRWATPKRQAYNSKRVRLIEFNGVTANLSDWERAAGLKECISYRLKRGWSLREAILTRPKALRGTSNEEDVMLNIKRIVSEIDDA